MGMYCVSFELTGTVTVEAKDIDEAIQKASLTPTIELVDCIENSNFGNDYVEEQ